MLLTRTHVTAESSGWARGRSRRLRPGPESLIVCLAESSWNARCRCCASLRLYDGATGLWSQIRRTGDGRLAHGFIAGEISRLERGGEAGWGGCSEMASSGFGQPRHARGSCDSKSPRQAREAAAPPRCSKLSCPRAPPTSSPIPSLISSAAKLSVLILLTQHVLPQPIVHHGSSQGWRQVPRRCQVHVRLQL